MYNSTTSEVSTIISPSTPTPGNKSASNIVGKALDVNIKTKRSKECLKWGSINVVLVSILLFDINNKCPYVFSKWYYLEYFAALILSLSVVYYFITYLYYYYLFHFDPIVGTDEQRQLLKFEIGDNSFITKTPDNKKSTNDAMKADITALNWRQNSFNDSNQSAGWMFSTNASPSHLNNSFNQSQNVSFNASYPKINSPYINSNNNSFNNSHNSLNSNNSGALSSSFKKYANKNEFIMDTKGLQQYLKEVEEQEKNISIPQEGQSINGNMMNSFWNNFKLDDMSTLLKTSIYQLSPTTVSPNKQTSKDEGNIYGPKDADGNSEIIKNVSSVKLSSYVANLRLWISCTILKRLETEMNMIDKAFKSHGFSDLQLGCAGLERLKKTAENQLITAHIPMLRQIIPFLEISSNQEYLVQRIKDLAKGSCIADYRWNSVSSYKGLSWDEHLPTDSAIIFHLFCTYLDTQLRPLPQPGGRPFYNRYVVIGDKKTPNETITEISNKAKCAILCTNPLKPKFNFISDAKIQNSIHDRNNLYYVLIQFLIYMKNHHEGILEGVNLNKSGINILCVIED